MIRTGSMSSRLAAGAVLGALLILGNVATVAAAPPPDQISGQVGEVDFRERAARPAPLCVYSEPEGGLSTIIYFRVRAPRVSWPDAHPSPSGEVGWRITVQENIDPAGDGIWYRVHRTNERRAIANEDSPAPFSNRTVHYSPGLSDVWNRVVVRIRWFNASGDVIGVWKHWYLRYGRVIDDGSVPGWGEPPDQIKNGKCRNRWFM